MNAWINVDENEPVSSKMTEDEITFSAQQEPQSELESEDDDDDDDERTRTDAINESYGAMHRSNIEMGRIVQEFNMFWYNVLQL